MITITDFRVYECRPETPVREAVQRIDRTRYLFQVVLDQAGRLLGTLTDGDVRRGILQGVGLDDAVRACMQTHPTTGRLGDGTGNWTKLANLGSTRTFLPILDERGTVVEILVRQLRAAEIAHAMVMAGGFGRRLGERTRDTPKPLLPVAGQPILDHVLRALEDAGVADIHISLHYLADKIKAFVAARTNRARIRFVEEETPLGTAGALARLGDIGHAPTLVVNGDVITQVDYAALHDFHLRHALDATIGVARHDVDVPFGVVRYCEDGLFAGIEEKPRISNFVAAGVYYLGPELIALVPGDRPMDMPELLNLGRQIGLRIGLFPIHEYWTDVGGPDALQAADALMSNGGNPAAP